MIAVNNVSITVWSCNQLKIYCYPQQLTKAVVMAT